MDRQFSFTAKKVILQKNTEFFNRSISTFSRTLQVLMLQEENEIQELVQNGSTEFFNTKVKARKIILSLYQ